MYAYALGGFDILIQNRDHTDDHCLPFSIKCQGPNRLSHWIEADSGLSVSALSFKCRQIRHEASRYVFAFNTFRGDVDTLTRFLRHRNTKEATIQFVRLDLDTKTDLEFSPEPKVLVRMLRSFRILRRLPSLKEALVCSQDHYWH